MRLTRAKNVLHFGIKCSKLRPFLGLRPRPRWGAYHGPPDPLVVRGFLPSAIAASRLRHLTLLELSKTKIPTLLAPQTQNHRTVTELANFSSESGSAWQ